MSIKNNTTSLQEVLETINGLPDVNGGVQATPVISISSNGLITATAGTKSSTYQLAFQPAKTITPGTTSQIAVSGGYYTGGNITVGAVPTQTKSVTPTVATQNVTPDSGKFLSKVTVVGDSNLVAGNIKSGVSIFGVSGTAEIGGGETVVDDVSKAIIEGTITEIEDDSVERISQYAFCDCSDLTTARFQACTSIGACAFSSCTKLATVSFPECTCIGNSAFAHCLSLTTVNFPLCTSIGAYAFSYCYNLAAASCSSCTYIDYGAFSDCARLATVSFPVCISIGSYAFCNAHYLSIVQLGGSSICTLKNSNAFSATPFAGYSSWFSGAPYIYVPSSLVTAYQSATNWTYFSSYFSSIESLGKALVTFKIDHVDYYVEAGMTWEEWVNSEYNTKPYYIDEYGYVSDASGNYIIYASGGSYVPSSDSIIVNGIYLIEMEL